MTPPLWTPLLHFIPKNIKLFSGFSDLFTYIQFDDKSAIFCLFVLMIQIVIDCNFEEEEERSLNFWTILYEIGHSGLLDYFRRHLNAFIIYSHNLDDPGF